MACKSKGNGEEPKGLPEELLARSDEIKHESAVIRQLLEHYPTKEELAPVTRRLSRIAWIAIALAVLVGGVGDVLLIRLYGESIRKAQAVNGCEQINVKALKPLHDLLVSAQTASDRNPIPPGLSEETRVAVEKARAESVDLYRRGIAATEPSNCHAIYEAAHGG